MTTPPPGYGPPPGGDPGTGLTPLAGQPGYGSPAEPGAGWGAAPGPPTGPPQTSTKAVIALVCAISAYLPVIPFFGAIAGVVLARIAKREIQVSGGRLTGEGLATAAFWISVVHLVFVAALVLLVGLFLVVFGGFGLGLDFR